MKQIPLSQMILQELKRLLKQNKIQYKELAADLKLSESGLKKLMNSKDCSLSRLEQICDFIGISLSDLISDLEDQNLKSVSFTAAQEKYFLSHRIGFLVFWCLVYERRSSEDAMSLLKLSKKDFWKILHQLDSLDLVVLLANDKIRVPQPIGIQWVGRTKFITELYLQWSDSLLKEVVAASSEDSNQSQTHYMIRYLQMSDQTWGKFKRSLSELEKSYSNIAVREMRLKSSKLRHVRWLMAADNQSWAQSEFNAKTQIR